MGPENKAAKHVNHPDPRTRSPTTRTPTEPPTLTPQPTYPRPATVVQRYRQQHMRWYMPSLSVFPAGISTYFRACHGPTPWASPSVLMWWAAARPDPSIFQGMGRGPAQPIHFSEDGPWPGPRHIFPAIPDPARPGPSHAFEAHGIRALYGSSSGLAVVFWVC